jgi:hypothetical protein
MVIMFSSTEYTNVFGNDINANHFDSSIEDVYTNDSFQETYSINNLHQAISSISSELLDNL